MKSEKSSQKQVWPDAVKVAPSVNELATPALSVDEVNVTDGEQIVMSSGGGIHDMKAAEVVEVNEQATDQTSTCVPQQCDDAGMSLGWRLARARARQGWSQAEVAARLRLPAKLIDRLERDDYAGLTQGVFLRGYLGSYARLVNVSIEQAEDVAAAHSEAAPLVATGTIPRSRYLFERYSVSATYLVLTAIIVVPVVWLATHGGLEQNFAHTTPLDPPAAEVAAVQPASASLVSVQHPADSTGTVVASPKNVPSAESAVQQTPIVASIAPFSVVPSQPLPQASAQQQPIATSVGSGAHTLELKLTQQSWVEITTADGRKLEYGMLAAGSEHTYHSDGPLSVRIGNTQGTEILVDGRTVDLTAFQRANVAHVKLFDETGAPASRLE
jgi:cytoskeleton protein RodZ